MNSDGGKPLPLYASMAGHTLGFFLNEFRGVDKMHDRATQIN